MSQEEIREAVRQALASNDPTTLINIFIGRQIRLSFDLEGYKKWLRLIPQGKHHLISKYGDSALQPHMSVGTITGFDLSYEGRCLSLFTSIRSVASIDIAQLIFIPNGWRIIFEYVYINGDKGLAAIPTIVHLQE